MLRNLTVVGVSDHYARAILVSVAARDGAPEIINRREVPLLEPGLPDSPYHHETLKMDGGPAEKLVKQVCESAVRCAERELAQLISERKTTIAAIVLREPPIPQLPASVAEAHESYNVTNRADGMIYHDALCKAAAKHGIAVHLIRRGQERPRAAEVLGVSAVRLDRWLSELRKTLGPPWQKDHQDAVARAIVGLRKYRELRLPDSNP
jgi:hypothetical protein